jgi:hypothetical protein
VIEGEVSVSDSGTMFVHEGADRDDGSRGGEVGVVEMGSRSDSGTSFMHEDASDGAESEVGVIEGMSSDSCSGSGWTFVTEGAGMYGVSENKGNGRGSDGRGSDV